MQLSTNKILLFTIAVVSMVTVSVLGFAQNKIKQVLNKDKPTISIGFQTGRELLFNTTPLLHSKQSKVHYGISKSLVLRKSIAPHFKLETMLGYSSIQNTQPNLSNSPFRLNSEKQNKFSLPVTIQYYFLPEKNKFRPFCGAGFQCNCFSKKNNFSTNNTASDINQQYYNTQPDTKYITILFTQGVTFEVTTKIRK